MVDNGLGLQKHNYYKIKHKMVALCVTSGGSVLCVQSDNLPREVKILTIKKVDLEQVTLRNNEKRNGRLITWTMTRTLSSCS